MIARRLAEVWLLLVVIWAVFTPRADMNLDTILQSPAVSGPFLGTDAFGRDLFRTLAEGIGHSLSFAFISTFAAVVTGVILGSILGTFWGRTRDFLERVLDFFLAFPPMLLALAVQAQIGSGWRSLAIAVTFGLFPGIVRFVSSRAKEVTLTEYLSSARALGGSAFGNFRRHYYPDLIDHLRLKFPSLFAQAILLEATLSFLNLGVQPGVVSWGALLAHGKDYLVEAPYIAWFVGFPLALTLFALQAWIDDATRVPHRLKSL